ncbi:MAG: hypothetical protein MUE44_19430 [Oscillatoriaceae cyanobacterium Prado104]|nr:hypothetical protein [Oscillatoriaceae cyanobacterium Prado104]
MRNETQPTQIASARSNTILDLERDLRDRTKATALFAEIQGCNTVFSPINPVST